MGIQAQCASLFIISVLNRTQHCRICVVLLDIPFSLKQRESTAERLHGSVHFYINQALKCNYSVKVLYQVFNEIWRWVPMPKNLKRAQFFLQPAIRRINADYFQPDQNLSN